MSIRLYPLLITLNAIKENLIAAQELSRLWSDPPGSNFLNSVAIFIKFCGSI